MKSLITLFILSLTYLFSQSITTLPNAEVKNTDFVLFTTEIEDELITVEYKGRDAAFEKVKIEDVLAPNDFFVKKRDKSSGAIKSISKLDNKGMPYSPNLIEFKTTDYGYLLVFGDELIYPTVKGLGGTCVVVQRYTKSFKLLDSKVFSANNPEKGDNYLDQFSYSIDPQSKSMVFVHTKGEGRFTEMSFEYFDIENNIVSKKYDIKNYAPFKRSTVIHTQIHGSRLHLLFGNEDYASSGQSNYKFDMAWVVIDFKTGSNKLMTLVSPFKDLEVSPYCFEILALGSSEILTVIGKNNAIKSFTRNNTILSFKRNGDALNLVSKLEFDKETSTEGMLYCLQESSYKMIYDASQERAFLSSRYIQVIGNASKDNWDYVFSMEINKKGEIVHHDFLPIPNVYPKFSIMGSHLQIVKVAKYNEDLAIICNISPNYLSLGKTPSKEYKVRVPALIVYDKDFKKKVIKIQDKENEFMHYNVQSDNGSLCGTLGKLDGSNKIIWTLK